MAITLLDPSHPVHTRTLRGLGQRGFRNVLKVRNSELSALIFSGNDAVVEGHANFTRKRYATLEDAAVCVAPAVQSASVLRSCSAIGGQVVQNPASHARIIFTFSIRDISAMNRRHDSLALGMLGTARSVNPAEPDVQRRPGPLVGAAPLRKPG